MLNKEIFIKKNHPPLHWVYKDCHIYFSSPRFHNYSVSWDCTVPLCSIYLQFAVFLSLLCAPSSDTRSCGTDTWVSSKAVSSRCITTEASVSQLVPLLSPLSLWFVFPPGEAVVLALQFVLSLFADEFLFSSSIIPPSLAPMAFLQCL